MLTEDHLRILQEKIQHSFSDINQLKRQLILFHAYFLNCVQKQLPFPEISSQYSVSELMLPAIQLANQNRQRKQEFINYLYQSIKSHLSESSEKDRRELFKYISKKI